MRLKLSCYDTINKRGTFKEVRPTVVKKGLIAFGVSVDDITFVVVNMLASRYYYN